MSFSSSLRGGPKADARENTSSGKSRLPSDQSTSIYHHDHSIVAPCIDVGSASTSIAGGCELVSQHVDPENSVDAARSMQAPTPSVVTTDNTLCKIALWEREARVVFVLITCTGCPIFYDQATSPRISQCDAALCQSCVAGAIITTNPTSNPMLSDQPALPCYSVAVHPRVGGSPPFFNTAIFTTLNLRIAYRFFTRHYSLRIE